MLQNLDFNCPFPSCVWEPCTDPDALCQRWTCTLWSKDFLFRFWQEEVGKFHIKRLETKSVCMTGFCQRCSEAQPSPCVMDYCEWEQIILAFSWHHKTCLLTAYCSCSIISPVCWHKAQEWTGKIAETSSETRPGWGGRDLQSDQLPDGCGSFQPLRPNIWQKHSVKLPHHSQIITY